MDSSTVLAGPEGICRYRRIALSVSDTSYLRDRQVVRFASPSPHVGGCLVVPERRTQSSRNITGTLPVTRAAGLQANPFTFPPALRMVPVAKRMLYRR